MSSRKLRRKPTHQTSNERDSARITLRAEISRRQFLKLFHIGLLSAIALPFYAEPDPLQSLAELSYELNSGLASAVLPGLAQPRQGRVAYERVGVHQQPSFSSPEIAVHYKDTVLAILGYALGDEEPAHNRVWYQLGEHRFVHSGGVQPVATRPNQPERDIPPGGRLGEVTVPFSDAYWGPGLNFPHAYRFYYATTHWITGLVAGEDGEAWYQLLDDKWDFELFVPARHLRLIPAEELAPISPELPLSAKRLVVNRERQVVIGYDWNRPVFIARAATGAKFSNGDFTTPAGYHITSAKRATRHMAAGNLAYNGYDLPGVPWVTYFTQNGISFHGTYWHNNYGKPRSHGCVNLSPAAARWIYRWTLPVVPPDTPERVETYGTGVWVV